MKYKILSTNIFQPNYFQKRNALNRFTFMNQINKFIYNAQCTLVLLWYEITHFTQQ